MHEKLRKLAAAAIVSVGTATMPAHGQMKTEAPEVHEIRGKNVRIRFTPFAFKDLGYSFFVREDNGVMTMCEPNTSCRSLDPKDPVDFVFFNLKDIDTTDGKKILMCTTRTLSDGTSQESFDLLRPDRLVEVPADDELVELCFPKLTT